MIDLRTSEFRKRTTDKNKHISLRGRIEELEQEIERLKKQNEKLWNNLMKVKGFNPKKLKEEMIW